MTDDTANRKKLQNTAILTNFGNYAHSCTEYTEQGHIWRAGVDPRCTVHSEFLLDWSMFFKNRRKAAIFNKFCNFGASEPTAPSLMWTKFGMWD